MIIDAHSDVLSKLFHHSYLHFALEAKELAVSVPAMQKADVKLQFMAIFLDETKMTPTLEPILAYVDILYKQILTTPGFKLVTRKQDLKEVKKGSERGVLLTLEGVDGLQANLLHFRILYYLGVRSIGLTWNHGNWAADGVMEPRKGGLTLKGRQLVQEMKRLSMIVDVSHLSEQAFWELMEIDGLSILASHSNCQAICPHPRNLSNNQINALIQRKSCIGLTFVPWFIREEKKVSLDDLLLHLDHICSLGGENCVGFGSDFDGFDSSGEVLERCEDYIKLADALFKRYTDNQVKKILFQNWYDFLERALPV